jgi:hypothetical protein
LTYQEIRFLLRLAVSTWQMYGRRKTAPFTFEPMWAGHQAALSDTSINQHLPQALGLVVTPLPTIFSLA